MGFQISSATVMKSPLAGTIMAVPFVFTANAVSGSGKPAGFSGFPYISTIKQTNANVMTVTFNVSIVNILGITAELNANTSSALGDYLNPGNYAHINDGSPFAFDLNYIAAGGSVGAWPNSASVSGFLLVQNVGGLYGSGGK